MDYCELNLHVESKPGQDTAICQEKLREWRKQGTVTSLLDLRKEYLQVYDELQRFQVERYEGQLYVSDGVRTKCCTQNNVKDH